MVFSPNEHLFSCFSDFLSFSQFVENALIYRGTPLHKPDEHVCKKYSILKIQDDDDDDDVDDDDDEIFVIIIIYESPDTLFREYLRTSEETAVRISHSVFTTNWFILQSTYAFT